MKLYEIFFSPTGGTRKVADILASAWKDETVVVDLLREPNALSSLQLTENDVCIFALPSFGGRIPAVVAPSLKRLRGNGAKGVLVAVFGNRAIDDTLMEMHDILTAAGIACVAGVEAVAEHSLCRLYAAGRPDATDVKELQGFGKDICDAIESGKAKTDVALPGHHEYRAYGGVPFKPVATDRCDRCGLCAKECPVHAIPPDAPWKTDADRCISCMHCVAVCPVHARAFTPEIAAIAKEKMGAKCSGHKPNKLYL